MISLQQAMARTPYPGRGIVLGMSADGASALCAYFIMGRSVNSRNRVFVTDGDGLRTQAHDPSKLSDPSLIIYAPVRVLDGRTIVTNGDQTDTIYKAMGQGGTFESALRTRAFEPDAPNWTPRISGILELGNGSFSYKLSILKSAQGNPDACLRFFYEYETPQAGVGHFIHTYAHDGDPLPSFTGDPEAVVIEGNIDEITLAIWNALNEDNKVSLFVRTIGLQNGETDTRIVNKLA